MRKKNIIGSLITAMIFTALMLSLPKCNAQATDTTWIVKTTQGNVTFKAKGKGKYTATATATQDKKTISHTFSVNREDIELMQRTQSPLIVITDKKKPHAKDRTR